MAGTGKSFQDRELAAEVRSLCLEEIRGIFLFKHTKGDKYDPELNITMAAYKKQLVLKMSTSILPRLNEVTGADGGAIEVNDISKLSDDELIKIAKGGKGVVSEEGVSKEEV